MGGLNLIEMWGTMSTVAKGVAFVLVFMSMWSFGVAIERIYTYMQAKNQSKMFAPQVAKHLKEGRLKDAIAAVAEDYDYILIDCPPTLGRLTVNAFMAADTVLAPVQCHYFALEGLRDLTAIVTQVREAGLNPKLEIGHYLITMFEKSKNLSVEVATDMRDTFGERVFRTAIPYNVKLAEAPSMGMSVLKHAGSSTGAKAYRAVAKELSNGRKPQAG